jgi:hypothetical protein
MMSQTMLRRLLYGSTIFCSSLLLFLIQPMMAKAALPWFGGSAGVWASAMLFFQSMLLLGYFYAHWTTRRLAPRHQIGLHVLLLAASLFALPVAPSPAWKPPAAAEPITRILAMLAASVGLPYLLLSATGPLVQAWYARCARTAYPYRLFAVSNLASLAALMMYPVAIEPLVSTRHQLLIWSAAYAGFVLLAGSAAFLSAAGSRPEAAKTAPPAVADRLLWIALAVCPSILWLGVANTLSQIVAPIPFLWVLPLSIYLLSFILCFDREGWYRPAVFRVAMPAGWILMCLCLAMRSPAFGLKWVVLLFSVALFACCLFCHGELARRKPHPDHLTSYYLMLALGGALGGVFVGLVAPTLFSGYLELPVGVAGCIILGMGVLYGYPLRKLARLGGVAAVAFLLAVQINGFDTRNRLRSRNFYGSLQVSDTGAGNTALRILSNGPIHHGSEFLSPEKSRLATTYYGTASGAALAIRSLPERARRIGVIGLGAGTLACYARAGDYYRFYEINPAVIQVANTEFRYLRECLGQVEVVSGDGRLALERELAQRFDLLVLDAFSGDSIPTHLFTREAFAVYFSHLVPDGVLAAHITNKYLDLSAVVKGLGDASGRQSRLMRSPAEPGRGVYGATWVLVTANAEVLRALAGMAIPFPPGRPSRVWTDDYSNLFQTLR